MDTASDKALAKIDLNHGVWNLLRMFPTKFGVEFHGIDPVAETLLKAVQGTKLSSWKAHQHPEFRKLLGTSIFAREISGKVANLSGV